MDSCSVKSYNIETWDEYTKIIKNSLLQIANNIKDLSLKDEFNDFLKIKNMITYILEDQILFNKYSYFINNLLDSFLLLMYHYESDNSYDTYHNSFSKRLDNQFDFFLDEIHKSSLEDEKNVLNFTRETMNK